MRLNFNSVRKYFLCVVAAFGVTGASAAPHACLRTNVFYVNGVFNFSSVEAYESAIELRRALIQEGVADAGLFRIRTIWNPGSIGDVAEVLVGQGELNPGFVLLTALLRANLGLFVQTALSATEVLARQSSADAIKEIKNIVRASIENEKAPALVVAHSQGNIFVNKAISELTTEDGPKDIPGIKNIAVLGLGVAAGVDSVGLITPTRYEYLTAQGDKIIDGALRTISNIPSANFLSVQWNLTVDDQKPFDSVSSILSTRHKIAETYLSTTRGINENGISTTFSAEVTRKFVKLRNVIDAAWPCIKDIVLPTSVKQFSDAELAVKTSARPGDSRAPQGSVQFTYGGGVAFFGGGCSRAPIRADGYARCTPNFRMPPGTYSLQVNGFLNDPFKWTVDKTNDTIGLIRVGLLETNISNFSCNRLATTNPNHAYEFELLADGTVSAQDLLLGYDIRVAIASAWDFAVSVLQINPWSYTERRLPTSCPQGFSGDGIWINQGFYTPYDNSACTLLATAGAEVQTWNAQFSHLGVTEDGAEREWVVGIFDTASSKKLLSSQRVTCPN